MNGEARSWLGLLVIVALVLGLLSVMIILHARGRDERRVKRALALIWAAVPATIGVGWLVRSMLGGPVFELNLFRSPQLLVSSLSGARLALLIGGLAVIIALYVAAVLALRGVMCALPPATILQDDDAGEPDWCPEDEQQ
ncbi:MAG: hypothetical protein J7M38_15000 [Armatimonadetes bacterium]|nr:hypothetical protein [Armatimonadota bacterium]